MMKRYLPVGWILPGLIEHKDGAYVLYEDMLKEIRNFIDELGWKTHQATDLQIKKYFGGEEYPSEKLVKRSESLQEERWRDENNGKI